MSLLSAASRSWHLFRILATKRKISSLASFSPIHRRIPAPKEITCSAVFWHNFPVGFKNRLWSNLIGSFQVAASWFADHRFSNRKVSAGMCLPSISTSQTVLCGIAKGTGVINLQYKSVPKHMKVKTCTNELMQCELSIKEKDRWESSFYSDNIVPRSCCVGRVGIGGSSLCPQPAPLY